MQPLVMLSSVRHCLLLLVSTPVQVGYISPDLFTHSVSYFAEAPLTHHNPSAVHVTVYCCVPKPDPKTTRLQEAVEQLEGSWKDVTTCTEPQLADTIRQDKIDILVELTGGCGC